MASLPVTSIVVGIFALLIVPLSVQISLRRAKTNSVFGDGGDEVLRKRIRAHGNFIEYAPLAAIAVGMIEFRAAPTWLISSLACGFVVSRVLHAAGMLFTSTPPVRALAMLLNHASFLAAGAWLIYSAV